MKINEATLALAALAQETRLSVFRLLVEAGVEGLSAGEIAEALGAQPATLSFHLKELVTARLIARERRGRTVNYAVNAKGMSALMEFLTRDCCEGRPELCGGAKPKGRAKARA
jgi:DNA-binding transcriptional ArsR family regulator